MKRLWGWIKKKTNAIKNYALKGRPPKPVILEWQVPNFYFEKITTDEAKFLLSTLKNN